MYASEQQADTVGADEARDVYFIIDADGIALNIEGETYEDPYAHGVMQALAEVILTNDGLSWGHPLKIEAERLVAKLGPFQVPV